MNMQSLSNYLWIHFSSRYFFLWQAGPKRRLVSTTQAWSSTITDWSRELVFSRTKVSLAVLSAICLRNADWWSLYLRLASVIGCNDIRSFPGSSYVVFLTTVVSMLRLVPGCWWLWCLTTWFLLLATYFHLSWFTFWYKNLYSVTIIECRSAQWRRHLTKSVKNVWHLFCWTAHVSLHPYWSKVLVQGRHLLSY